MNMMFLLNKRRKSFYSLLINTSKMSTDEVVETIAALYDKKAGLTTFKGAFQDQYIEHKSFKI